VTHGFDAERKNGTAASELRCRCAWLHHGSGPWTHRIQGCGGIDPRPKASSPRIVIPIAPSVPSRSKPSRCGLPRAEHASRLVRRPTLTAPARADMSEARVGTEKRLSDRTKKLMKEKRCVTLPRLLDKKTHTRVTPRFRHRLIRFRHFIGGLLALASLNRACRNLCPGFSATFTTTALDDSSLRGLEAST
jgi:hypothetical protein